MSILFTILSVLYIVGCLALIGVILLQKKRSAGIGNLGTTGGSNQTYWDKNKGRSLDGMLEKYTKLGGLLFFILTVVLCVVK